MRFRIFLQAILVEQFGRQAEAEPGAHFREVPLQHQNRHHETEQEDDEQGGEED
jgi:hypothetical protein